MFIAPVPPKNFSSPVGGPVGAAWSSDWFGIKKTETHGAGSLRLPIRCSVWANGGHREYATGIELTLKLAFR